LYFYASGFEDTFLLATFLNYRIPMEIPELLFALKADIGKTVSHVPEA